MRGTGGTDGLLCQPPSQGQSFSGYVMRWGIWLWLLVLDPGPPYQLKMAGTFETKAECREELAIWPDSEVVHFFCAPIK